jgi:polyisoprenoid-binding protein YceI
MTVAKGTHNIGPEDGHVFVNVYKEGAAAAKMGHDLKLEATSWSGKADLNPDDPSGCTVSVTIDPDSLDIVEATGGGKPLSQGDKADIKKNSAKVLGRGDITFESTGVSGSAPRLQLKGDLTLGGQTRPVTLDLDVNDNGQVTAKTSFKQKDFGIKPFSAPLGILKVKDEVEVTIELQLPTA